MVCLSRVAVLLMCTLSLIALAAQKAKCPAQLYFGCTKSSVASRVREVILPLCSETSPGVLHPDVESSAQERHGAVGVHPEEGHKNDPRAGTALL